MSADVEQGWSHRFSLRFSRVRANATGHGAAGFSAPCTTTISSPCQQGSPMSGAAATANPGRLGLGKPGAMPHNQTHVRSNKCSPGLARALGGKGGFHHDCSCVGPQHFGALNGRTLATPGRCRPEPFRCEVDVNSCGSDSIPPGRAGRGTGHRAAAAPQRCGPATGTHASGTRWEWLLGCGPVDQRTHLEIDGARCGPRRGGGVDDRYRRVSGHQPDRAAGYLRAVRGQRQHGRPRWSGRLGC
jgi:hypothetical protein